VKIVRTGLVMVGVIASLNSGGVAHAASENLPWSDGGGGLSDFQVKSGSACTSNGVGFRDDENYGFDMAGLLSVNGIPVGAAATAVDVTTNGTDSIATYTETLGALAIAISYRFTDGNIARTLVTLTNNGSSLITGLPVDMQHSHSDFGFQFMAGSTWRNSGDWFILNEEGVPSNTIDNYTAALHLPDGPGSPESVASIDACVGVPINNTTVGDINDVVYGYSIDIPAGESRRLLTYHGIASTADALKSIAETFASSLPSPGSGLLSDLSETDACTVVNWDFCGSGGSQPEYDFDIDISNYQRESDLPDTE